MTDYLPNWATPDEAAGWLEARTGEAWPLPRMIEAGLTPRVWLEPNGESLQNAAVFEQVFDRRAEGFLAPMVFAGDTCRLAIDRSVTLSMTRTPRGDLVKFTPPASADLGQLRFAATDVRELAPTPAAAPPKLSQAAVKAERERTRLEFCEREGITFDKRSQLRLPDGIGKVAEKLGITRQSLSTDVKAALGQRFEANRNGMA